MRVLTIMVLLLSAQSFSGKIDLIRRTVKSANNADNRVENVCHINLDENTMKGVMRVYSIAHGVMTDVKTPIGLRKTDPLLAKVNLVKVLPNQAPQSGATVTVEYKAGKNLDVSSGDKLSALKSFVSYSRMKNGDDLRAYPGNGGRDESRELKRIINNTCPVDWQTANENNWAP